MVRRMVLNETSYFGENSREVLKDEIPKRGYKKAFVVSDKSLVDYGITKKVTDVLDGINMSYEVFSDIKPNPTVKSVQHGVDNFKKSGADFILAVGGGSSIDVSKGIGIIANNMEHYDVVSLNGAVNTKNKSIPIIAMPTTAGTAAEVTINYVITDEKSNTKMVCVDPNDIPILAIIDTDLMKSMPFNLAAQTGMDALTHAIEGYITKASWEMTNMMHLKAIEMIMDNLEEAVIEKKDSAIEAMGVAQYIAGMGFSNVGLGIVHSMAHQLGAVYDTPHGLANAILLPYVMDFNAKECYEKFAEIADMLELPTENMNYDEISDLLINYIRGLAITLNIPQHLREIGVKEEDLMMLSEKALKDPCTPGNPIDVTVEDIYNIFKAAY